MVGVWKMECIVLIIDEKANTGFLVECWLA